MSGSENKSSLLQNLSPNLHTNVLALGGQEASRAFISVGTKLVFSDLQGNCLGAIFLHTYKQAKKTLSIDAKVIGL